MIKISTKFILYTALILVVGCKQQDKNIEKETSLYLEIEQNLDSLLNQQYQSGKLNGNVLVIRKGKKLYEKSFGYADASKKTMLNKDFRFGIGSIYKEFPAVAIMQLSQLGKVNLDDNIQKHLPELPKWSQEISILHLLQYSSGLPKIDWGKYFSAEEIISDEDIMNDLLKLKELEFQPGSGYIYSNNNPFLLIKIIENITNQKFSDYTQEHLFNPFNLKNTVIKSQYPYKDKTLMALPFNSEFEEDNYKINTPAILFTSTAEDIYNWLQHLHSFTIISEQSLKTLTETAKIKDIDMQAPLGNCILDDNKITEHTHHGSSGNYECLIQRFNQNELSIIMLTNQKNKNVFDISEKIKNIVNSTQTK